MEGTLFDSEAVTLGFRRWFLPLAALAVVAILVSGCGAGLNDKEGVAGASEQETGGAEEAPAPDRGNGHEFLPHDERGGVPLEYEMDGDVKVFRLHAEVVENWEVEPGQFVEAWTFNGMVPGPEIRVQKGDRVRIHVTNGLPEPTVVHWHGLWVPNDQDGVPYITQDPIEPGASFTYEFTVKNSGTHMYHPHMNSFYQVNKGMYGAFIIEDPDEPEYDEEYVLFLGDALLGLTINGKGFPYTEPLTAKVGDKVRVRFLNIGEMAHPMHLHGMPMKVFANDGYPVPQPYELDTINIAPGERYDVEIHALEPGVWAFHCHILSHAESAEGMHGMVTALIIGE